MTPVIKSEVFCFLEHCEMWSRHYLSFVKAKNYITRFPCALAYVCTCMYVCLCAVMIFLLGYVTCLECIYTPDKKNQYGFAILFVVGVFCVFF